MDDTCLMRAFEVEEISDNFDPSILPATGQEYLKHVMYEASKCPDVVVANVNRKEFICTKGIASTLNLISQKSELTPSKEWQHQQIAMFSDLRKKVEKCRKSSAFKPVSMPKSYDEDEWYNICFGQEMSKPQPSLSLLLSMNELMLGRLLEYHADWLSSGLKPNQGKWIYALLACLDLPLRPEICSVIRDLARECAKIRLTKVSPKDGDVTVLNLIICLVSNYFGQTDLAD